MFQQSTIAILILLLIFAVLVRQPALVLICILLLLAAGTAHLWSRWSLQRVDYMRHLSQTRVFPGDEVELHIRITNRKPLPLARLRVIDKLPLTLEVIDAPAAHASLNVHLIQRNTTLRWYESVVWRYRVRCTARGAYRIGPAQLTSGDPFGLNSETVEHAVLTHFIVYPLPLPLDELGLPAHNPLGDVRSGQLFRDPLRTIGVRDYAPFDPFKNVHWAATARTGTLQTRVYEPTTSQVLAIFLDLDTFEFYYEGIDPVQVERMISAVATLAREGLDAGYAVGLYINGAPPEYEQLTRLPPGRSPAQLGQIMETLARLTAYSVTPMARLLRLTTRDLPPGATILLVSSVASENIRAALLSQREHGHHVAWMYMGASPTDALPGVSIFRAATTESVV